MIRNSLQDLSKIGKSILHLLLQAFKTILHVVRRETYKLPSGSSVARLRDSLVQILNFWIIQTSPNLPHFALPSNKHCISCSNTETFISCHAFRTAHCLFVLYRLPWIFLTVLCQNIYISTQCNCTLSVDFNTCSDIHITAKPYKGTLIMWFHVFSIFYEFSSILLYHGASGRRKWREILKLRFKILDLWKF